MDASDAYIEQLIREKRQARQLAQAWSVIAACMQQIVDGTGQGFGLPPLTPDLPMPTLQQVARQLGARLQPPPPANGSDGQRVAVAAGHGPGDDTDGD